MGISWKGANSTFLTAEPPTVREVVQQDLGLG